MSCVDVDMFAAVHYETQTRIVRLVAAFNAGATRWLPAQQFVLL